MAAMSQFGSESAPDPSGSWFATTHWSVVLTAKEEDSTQANAALETLCRTYRQPIYAFTLSLQTTCFHP